MPGVMSSFRDDILRGQVALVTGGGSGIGAGVAQALAAHGARVAVCGRTQARVDAVAERIVAAGGEAVALAADVRRPEALAAVMTAIEARWGRLDILINAAAGNFLAPAAALSANGFGTVVDIDLKGTFNACKAALPLLQVRGGSVVNISATLHYGGTPLQVHAASAKAGIDAMTRTLAVEWGPAQIRVNALAPGPHIKDLGAIRAAHPALRRGSRKTLSSAQDTMAYEVKDASETVYVVLNRGDAPASVGGVPAGSPGLLSHARSLPSVHWSPHTGVSSARWIARGMS